MADSVDCLIVGGGPAGLTGAIYAARFRLRVRVIDAGESRAALIARTHNHAGFPGGISGRELIARMRRQAVECRAAIDYGRVTRIASAAGGFAVITSSARVTARAVLLATGVTNRSPSMSEGVRRAALAAGRLRFCPVCDGPEVIDQTVAVIGTAERGVKEALFLRAYTTSVTLISPDLEHTLSETQRKALAKADVPIVEGPVSEFQMDPGGLSFACGDGRQRFEAVYPAMGSVVHSDLADILGADLTGEGCVKVDAHQRTSVEGLYAAGDVVIGLDQISHAMGEAGVAATTIRNDLAAKESMFA